MPHFSTGGVAPYVAEWFSAVALNHSCSPPLAELGRCHSACRVFFRKGFPGNAKELPAARRGSPTNAPSLTAFAKVFRGLPRSCPPPGVPRNRPPQARRLVWKIKKGAVPHCRGRLLVYFDEKGSRFRDGDLCFPGFFGGEGAGEAVFRCDDTEPQGVLFPGKLLKGVLDFSRAAIQFPGAAPGQRSHWCGWCRARCADREWRAGGRSS